MKKFICTALAVFTLTLPFTNNLYSATNGTLEELVPDAMIYNYFFDEL